MSTTVTLAFGDRILPIKSVIDVRYCCGRVGEATSRRRTFIGQYIQRYLDHITYERSELTYTQQSSSVEGLKIDTAYTNNIEARFDKDEKKLTHLSIWWPSISLLSNLKLSNYLFFNCVPLRRAWIPGHSAIDSKILCQNILERQWTNSINKMNLWTEIIDMNSAALKPQELNVLRFRETIQTDDVSVTVFKKRQDRKSRYIGLQSTFVEPEPYITDLNVQQRGDITDRCNIIDPGRRYLLYCVHENSTADALRTYRYTMSC
ncbi:hypothetical protein G6F44_012146 [Rhizopus delemar]|nr:hypothetical protein G6F44_012146 [Rhizopus delemar]